MVDSDLAARLEIPLEIDPREGVIDITNLKLEDYESLKNPVICQQLIESWVQEELISIGQGGIRIIEILGENSFKYSQYFLVYNDGRGDLQFSRSKMDESKPLETKELNLIESKESLATILSSEYSKGCVIEIIPLESLQEKEVTKKKERKLRREMQKRIYQIFTSSIQIFNFENERGSFNRKKYHNELLSYIESSFPEFNGMNHRLIANQILRIIDQQDYMNSSFSLYLNGEEMYFELRNGWFIQYSTNPGDFYLNGYEVQ